MLTGPNRIYWPVTKSVSFGTKLLDHSRRYRGGKRRCSLYHMLRKAPNSFNISHLTYSFPSMIFFFFFFLTLGEACFLLRTGTRMSSWKNKYIRFPPLHLQVFYYKPIWLLGKARRVPSSGCLDFVFNARQSPRAKKGNHLSFIHPFSLLILLP